MMFSATLSPEVLPICKKFMRNPTEFLFQSDTKLTLHGLQQYSIRLSEGEKNRKLNDLLDTLEFNQVIIFVKSTLRATELDKLLRECNFPSIAVHSGVSQEERYVSITSLSRVPQLTFESASNVTRNSRSSTSVSASRPMSLVVESISSESTWLSITTFPLMPLHTFIVLDAQAVLEQRVSASPSSAAIRMRRC
jgi:hypothetical protein